MFKMDLREIVEGLECIYLAQEGLKSVFLKHGSEPLGSIKIGEFDQLGDTQLLKWYLSHCYRTEN